MLRRHSERCPVDTPELFDKGLELCGLANEKHQRKIEFGNACGDTVGQIFDGAIDTGIAVRAEINSRRGAHAQFASDGELFFEFRL